jgi:hypothetical protein
MSLMQGRREVWKDHQYLEKRGSRQSQPCQPPKGTLPCCPVQEEAFLGSWCAGRTHCLVTWRSISPALPVSPYVSDRRLGWWQVIGTVG